ncbi:MAG: protein-glutamate O-methyltransferase CheR [Acidobacteria bacterium]|nr:protein-glutamate O-methyltransferase CheR [Acidobacteriota bacterium]
MTGEGIAERDFRELCALIQAECGIVFTANKRTMVESRLQRRARALGLGSLADYCGYLRGRGGRERETPHLVDAVTTHKTDFYREPLHFECLARQVLPDLVASGAGTRRPLEAWSAACSTGEEPYTMAMAMYEFGRGADQPLRCRVTGSDISLPVLDTARMGVYREEAIAPLPKDFRRYLLRSRDRSRGLVRIAPEIRAMVGFRQVNLMDSGYGFAERLDLVFCRNVMIYFTRSTQAAVLGRISATLRAGGYLFLGHSESLCGLDLPLTQVSATVYRRTHA